MKNAISITNERKSLAKQLKNGGSIVCRLENLKTVTNEQEKGDEECKTRRVRTENVEPRVEQH